MAEEEAALEVEESCAALVERAASEFCVRGEGRPSAREGAGRCGSDAIDAASARCVTCGDPKTRKRVLKVRAASPPPCAPPPSRAKSVTETRRLCARARARPQAVKGYVARSLVHRDAYLALLRLVDVTDDTVSVQRTVLAEMVAAPALDAASDVLPPYPHTPYRQQEGFARLAPPMV